MPRTSAPDRDPPRLKKHWGQHHLTDGRVCRPLVEYLAPRGERVVEIGPGGGVLTRELLRAGAAEVVGWEIDPEWAATLRAELSGEVDGEAEGRFSVRVGDALEIDWPRLAAEGAAGGTASGGGEADAGDLAGGGPPAPPPPGRVLAAGNLPYNVATPIIERLLPHHAAVPRAAFLVQKEVGERLVAGPGDADYGYLSVVVAAHAEARWLGIVKRGAFRPPPKVDGAFVGLALRPPPLPEVEMPAFLRLVGAAFALRRKTLRNSLATLLGKERSRRAVARLAAELGRDERLRAESLGLDELLLLHRLVAADEEISTEPANPSPPPPGL